MNVRLCWTTSSQCSKQRKNHVTQYQRTSTHVTQHHMHVDIMSHWRHRRLSSGQVPKSVTLTTSSPSSRQFYECRHNFTLTTTSSTSSLSLTSLSSSSSSSIVVLRPSSLSSSTWSSLSPLPTTMRRYDGYEIRLWHYGRLDVVMDNLCPRQKK